MPGFLTGLFFNLIVAKSSMILEDC